MNRVHNYLLALISGIVTLLVFSTVLVSCQKKMNDVTYYVSGIVYNDCSNTPFANRAIQLIHYTNSSVECNSYIPQTTTDATGRFTFAYSDNCSSFSYSDEYQIVVLDPIANNPVIVNRIPGKTNADVGAVYTNLKSKLEVKIKSISLHTNDTLYFGVSSIDFKTLYPVTNTNAFYEFTASTQLYQNKNTTNTLFYAIGINAYKMAILSPASSNSIPFQDYGCSAQADTVSLQLP